MAPEQLAGLLDRGRVDLVRLLEVELGADVLQPGALHQPELAVGLLHDLGGEELAEGVGHGRRVVAPPGAVRVGAVGGREVEDGEPGLLRLRLLGLLGGGEPGEEEQEQGGADQRAGQGHGTSGAVLRGRRPG